MISTTELTALPQGDLRLLNTQLAEEPLPSTNG
jgi:hypothetical protein